MPTRIIREGIIDSLAVNALSEPAEILYRRLMSIVDDYGRFDADPELIRARCFPRQIEKWTVSRISTVLHECSSVDHGGSPLVTVYHHGNKNYLQINNFGQRVQAKSKFPEPFPPLTTVDHGGSPPRATRARSESESDAKSRAETESKSADDPPTQNKTAEGDHWFEEIYTRHPKKGDRGLAQQYLSQSVFSAGFDSDDFDRVHKLWCDHWIAHGAQFAPKLAQWILDQGWRYEPPVERSGKGQGHRDTPPEVTPVWFEGAKSITGAELIKQLEGEV